MSCYNYGIYSHDHCSFNRYGIDKRGILSRGFPQCVGAIDGTFIPILAPSVSKSSFYNRKRFYFINVQAVCESRYR